MFLQQPAIDGASILSLTGEGLFYCTTVSSLTKEIHLSRMYHSVGTSEEAIRPVFLAECVKRLFLGLADECFVSMVYLAVFICRGAKLHPYVFLAM